MTATDPPHMCGESSDPECASEPESIWQRASAAFTAWRLGDARAMDVLVRTMTPVLWHVVRSYGLDRALAEDVVQVTWMTLLRGHERISDAAAVAGWLTTCARREAWRAAKAQSRVRPTEDLELEARLPVEASAESHAQTADVDHRLWRAVAKLDERCRRLLRIVAFEERPDYARIAQDLAMPVGSIGPTRRRCLGKVRAQLSADGWNGDVDER